MRRARTFPWPRIRPYRALLRGQGVLFAGRSSADCITNMSGFDLRQAQPGLRTPDQTLVTNDLSGGQKIICCHGSNFAWIYTPYGDSFTVNMGKISGSSVKAYWLDVRTGAITYIEAKSAAHLIYLGHKTRWPSLSPSRRCSPPSARWLRVLLPTTNGPARSAGHQWHVCRRYQRRLHRRRVHDADDRNIGQTNEICSSCGTSCLFRWRSNACTNLFACRRAEMQNRRLQRRHFHRHFARHQSKRSVNTPGSASRPASATEPLSSPTAGVLTHSLN